MNYFPEIGHRSGNQMQIAWLNANMHRTHTAAPILTSDNFGEHL